MDIQPQLLSFRHLISDKLFKIPEYQRAYSWGTIHRRALFDDINRTWEAGDCRSHFMATVVGLRRGTKKIIVDDYQEIDIVDGQQRITTLILLMKNIEKVIDRTDATGAKIATDLKEDLVKPDEASLLLLQTNHDTSHYFANYLRHGTSVPSHSATTLADRELLLAIEECEVFAREWQEAGRLNDLVDLIRNRLKFIFHETSDEAVVYTVFEVLNSRGLAVSPMDRLKSMLMAIVFAADTDNQDTHITEVHNLWSDIYRCIGLRQGSRNEALRFAATLRQLNRPNRPSGPLPAVEILHSQSKSGPAKVIEITGHLKSVTKAVDVLYQDHRRNAVTRIAQARLLAIAVHLREDFTESEKEQILKLWESVSFRIYGMFRKDARTGVGDYVRLAWRIHNDKPSYQAIIDAVSAIGKPYPPSGAIDELAGKDFYPDRTEETRYFLSRYEEHLARKEGQKFDNEQWNRIWEAGAADSIEHILPQSSEDHEYMHRIGNLLLLPPNLNSQLGDKIPSQKADAYQKTGLLQAQEVIPHLSGWNRRAIERRERELLQWAAQEWADS
jgi:hypothetical protein